MAPGEIFDITIFFYCFIGNSFISLSGILLVAATQLLLFILHERIRAYFRDIHFYGQIVGCLVCGLKSSTWPIRKCYVSKIYNKEITHANDVLKTPFFCVFSQLIFGSIVLTLSTVVHIDAIEIIDDPGTTAYQIMNFLCGFSAGFINIIVICHIADNVTKNHRASIATNIPLLLNGMNLLQVLFNDRSHDPDANYFYPLASTVCIVIIIISIILTWFNAYDPVTYFLKFNENAKAKQIFTDSNKGGACLADLQYEVGEIIEMLHDEKANVPANIFSNGNLKTIIVMSLLNLLCFLMYPFCDLLIWEVLPDNSATNSHYITFYIIAVVALSISKIASDLGSRKIIFWMCGIACIVISYFCVNYLVDYDHHSVSVIPFEMKCLVYSYITLFYFGIVPLFYVYSCESFPLLKRNASLACVSIMPTVIFYIIPLCQYFRGSSLSLVFGTMGLVLLLGVLLPNTGRLTLRQSRNKFNSYWENLQPRPTAPAV